TVVGFALAMVVDGQAHLREIDVLPSHGRSGIGTQLVAAVVAWAAASGLGAVTLTTFTHIPWNAPWYRRLGFSPTDEVGPELRQIMAEEREAGLDMRLRTAMRLTLPATGRD